MVLFRATAIFLALTALSRAAPNELYDIEIGEGIAHPTSLLSAVTNPAAVAMKKQVRGGALGASLLSGKDNATGIGGAAALSNGWAGVSGGGAYSLGEYPNHIAFLGGGAQMKPVNLSLGLSWGMQQMVNGNFHFVTGSILWALSKNFVINATVFDFWPEPSHVGLGFLIPVHPLFFLVLDTATLTEFSSYALKPAVGLKWKSFGASLGYGLGVGDDKGHGASALVKRGLSVGAKLDLGTIGRIEAYLDHYDSSYLTALYTIGIY